MAAMAVSENNHPDQMKAWPSGEGGRRGGIGGVVMVIKW